MLSVALLHAITANNKTCHPVIFSAILLLRVKHNYYLYQSVSENSLFALRHPVPEGTFIFYFFLFADRPLTRNCASLFTRAKTRSCAPASPGKCPASADVTQAGLQIDRARQFQIQSRVVFLSHNGAFHLTTSQFYPNDKLVSKTLNTNTIYIISAHAIIFPHKFCNLFVWLQNMVLSLCCKHHAAVQLINYNHQNTTYINLKHQIYNNIDIFRLRLFIKRQSCATHTVSHSTSCTAKTVNN